MAARWALVVVLAVPCATASTQDSTGLRLSRENPRYLEYQGRPILLISSAEHYGAVINLDFDFVPYLAALQRDGLNQTRAFVGFYVEDPVAFNITNNTLAPERGRYQPAWARSDQPGYAGGGNKFDLSKWNPEFWTRLRRYLGEAARRDIIVELVLFCPFYQASMWQLSPFHPGNNVNGLDAGLTRATVHDLRDPAVTALQEAYVRKLVTEVNGFDNIYFELVNEPYAYDDMIGAEFQRHVARLIVETEAGLTKRHLIAQGISNGSRTIDDPNPAVSIFNFHYAAPPTAVGLNDGLGKVIADDETGFRGQADLPYRIEAWNFLVAGGGIFSHLDYSFTTAHPEGTWVPLPASQPGGGGPGFRRQMRVLSQFMNEFEFVRMAPHDELLAAALPAGLQARVLAEPGRQYALYLSIENAGTRTQPVTEASLPAREVALSPTLPPGRYQTEWIEPASGRMLARGAFTHGGGTRALPSPPFSADVALRIRSAGF